MEFREILLDWMKSFGGNVELSFDYWLEHFRLEGNKAFDVGKYGCPPQSYSIGLYRF